MVYPQVDRPCFKAIEIPFRIEIHENAFLQIVVLPIGIDNVKVPGVVRRVAPFVFRVRFKNVPSRFIGREGVSKYAVRIFFKRSVVIVIQIERGVLVVYLGIIRIINAG